MAERPFFRKVFQMRHPIQGNPKYLQYRVETPYKNGHLDHIFVNWQDAIKFCDQSAAEFGVAHLFNHLTNKVIHFSIHETNYEANKANADFRDLEYEPNWTYNILNRIQKEVTK